MEAQISHLLTGRTRDDARAALARAFEEAAVMPGTLLPHELLDELGEAAGRIVAEVAASDADAVPENGCEPWSYIVEHTIGTTVAGLLIGRRLLPSDSLEDLGTGLFLQNIGMLALPLSLVQKPGPLEADERALMMKHPLLGLEFLRDDALGPAARSVVRSHHERWDGSGYPSGLVGDEASLFARIAAVAEAFDAMTSERYHARAVRRDVAVEIIRSGSGSDFDPAVVDAFLAVT
ncbi:MAG TPA: HD domain-containing phosphohydrolase [Thermoleophilaceae bacterium]|nr:HD domain-containing phosphohydrolase [Thermoleophilaceae bacterium]